MRTFLSLLAVSLPLTVFGQTANQATLTLVTEAGFNEADIDLNIDAVGASNDTSTLTGTIEVQLNISPSFGTTDEMTILSADVAGSDVTLARGGFLANYSLETDGLNFDATTPNAPGIVDPATGEFDATQHEVTVNEGTLDGSAYSILTGTEAVNFDFSDENVSGTGQGTGNITIVPQSIVGRKMYFEVTVELPLLLEETIEIEGAPVEGETVIEGTLKAKGQTFIELIDYATWAGSSGLAATSEDDFDLSNSTPNFMSFALGLDGNEVPEKAFEFSQNEITLTVGDGVALGNIEIQWSSDLVTWSRVPQSEMASGSSLISLGDSLVGGISVSRDDTKKFFRLARVAP